MLSHDATAGIASLHNDSFINAIDPISIAVDIGCRSSDPILDCEQKTDGQSSDISICLENINLRHIFAA
jgi:hypothetical protein